MIGRHVVFLEHIHVCLARRCSCGTRASLGFVRYTQGEEEFPPPAIGRIYALNSPELPFFIVGLIAAICQGAIFPSLAMYFAEILAVSMYS